MLLRRTLLLSAPALALGAVATLPGCGFALRQPPNFDFKTLYTNFSAGSSLGNQFKRSLASGSDVRIITNAALINEAEVLLDVLTDQRQKVVVGVSASGQVREFQLRVLFKFRLRRRDGAVLIPETEIPQRRDLSYNETQALAKEAEEALLYRDMESDVVQQLLRRLATIRTANPVTPS